METTEHLMQYALRALGQRALSQKELSERLQRRGATEAQQHEIVEKLLHYNMLNDTNIAEALSRKKGRGRGYIAQKLYHKGIDAKPENLRSDEDEAQELHRLIDKHFATWQKSGEKAYPKAVGFLVRRGFAVGMVHQALQHKFKHPPETEE